MPEPIVEEVNPSWGDMMEDLDEGPAVPPQSEVIEGNIRKLIEFKRDEKCLKKVTRVYSLETRKVSKSVAMRKTWKKFGNAVKDNPNGPDPSTTFVGDDVYLSFTTNKEELEEDKDDPLKKIGSSLVKCRTCKGEHWTAQCPYKDTLQPAMDLDGADKKKDVVDGNALAGSDLGSKTTGGKYISPALRAGSDSQRRGDTMNSNRKQADEAATLRVTNLSEDACEADLQDLFRPFGLIARVYLAKDKITNQSKGFAFVSYIKREDAARAIKALKGFGYDHLILNVEWARPSNN